MSVVILTIFLSFFCIYRTPQGTKVNGYWTEMEEHCIEQDIARMTNYEMRSLQADTYYRIELMAHNAIGFSKPAHVLMKTARGESDHSLGTTYDVYPAGFGGFSSASTLAGSPADVTLLLLTVSFVCRFVFV